MPAGAAALAVGAVLVTLSVNMSIGWDLSAMSDSICSESATFCDSVWWNYAVEYLPAWLFFGQILVAVVLGSPWAIVRRD